MTDIIEKVSYAPTVSEYRLLHRYMVFLERPWAFLATLVLIPLSMVALTAIASVAVSGYVRPESLWKALVVAGVVLPGSLALYYWRIMSGAKLHHAIDGGEVVTVSIHEDRLTEATVRRTVHYPWSTIHDIKEVKGVVLVMGKPGRVEWLSSAVPQTAFEDATAYDRFKRELLTRWHAASENA